MSLAKAKKYLEGKGYVDHIIELEDSSATVELAAQALGVEPGMIAKTLSFLIGDTPILILTEGTARIDNHKYKDTFHTKAKMIPFDDVEAYIGHAPGGVCPFGIKEGIPVYLDESLRKFDIVYPAAGNDSQTYNCRIRISLSCKKMGRCLQRIMSGYTIVMHRTFCEYHSEKSLIFY